MLYNIIYIDMNMPFCFSVPIMGYRQLFVPKEGICSIFRELSGSWGSQWTALSTGPPGPLSQGKMTYPLVMTNIAIENDHLQWIYLLKMVIFHSYVSLPEGRSGAFWSQECWFWGRCSPREVGIGTHAVQFEQSLNQHNLSQGPSWLSFFFKFS
jgi:hypothetical protein